MAHEIDDFFKQKVENIQDTLPENSTFDEADLWANIQPDLRKPKRLAWYWVVPVAACLLAVLRQLHPALPQGEGSTATPVAVKHEKTLEKSTAFKEKIKIFDPKKAKKVQVLKPKKIIVPQKLDFQLASISSKNIDFSGKNANNLPDSLTFQSKITFEKKPKMNIKIVHINEISKYEDAPFKQPRFKVQFAGTLFDKAEPNPTEIIKTSSIRIQ